MTDLFGVGQRWLSIIAVLCLTVVGCGGSFAEDPVTTSAVDWRGDPTRPDHEPPAVADGNWPSYRGARASGIAVGGTLPLRWDAASGANVQWKTAIPGLGHSSPVIWGDRVFVTSAINTEGEPYLRVGLYGESPDNPEEVLHHFNVYCLDRGTGEVIWERTAYSGVPQVQRHIKASHANSTPATDGRHLVVFFGSEGLFCYDLEGNVLWTKDLGFLDAGAFDMPEIQWGFGSSPTIHGERVFVLCDVNNQSFIAALDVATGEELWRTLRDEVPTWGTPTVYETAERTLVIVNGYQHMGAYDAATGEEVWRLSGGGDIPVPTPIIAHGLIFFSNSHGRSRPIYAIRLDAEGDISLQDGETSNEAVVWSKPRRGAYMPTPIVWGDHLYVLADNGVLSCYDARTGEQAFRERVAGERGAFTASPVAADGKLYITGEHGEVHVLSAGPEYRHLATNTMGEPCLATPAISGDTLFVRSAGHLVAVRDRGEAVDSAVPEEESPDEAPPASHAEATPQPMAGIDTGLGVLQRMDAACKAVDSVRYQLTVESIGAAEPYYGRIEAAVIAQGHLDGFPERYFIEGTASGAGWEEPVAFEAGSDGDRYWLIDHVNRRVHRDLDTSVFGHLRRQVLGALVRELNLPEPFEQEIGSATHELLEPEVLRGVDCHVIRLTFEEGQGEATWHVAKQGFLPAKRHDRFPMGEGQTGELLTDINEIELAPKPDPAAFAGFDPEGYEVTDRPWG